jgi:mRNA (2'-O-methyladenosine-N6-)-methyltransferase
VTSDIEDGRFDLRAILGAESVREREHSQMGAKIEALIRAPTTTDRKTVQTFKTKGGTRVKYICEHGLKDKCRAVHHSPFCCEKLHFREVIQSHTDRKLGDCSYLNACRHLQSCKFVHYEMDPGTATAALHLSPPIVVHTHP